MLNLKLTTVTTRLLNNIFIIRLTFILAAAVDLSTLKGLYFSKFGAVKKQNSYIISK